MIGAHPSVVVRVVAALVSPFIAVYGLYVIVHGHYGPGGGFAGGVFVALGAILPRLTLDEDVAYRVVPPVAGPLLGGIGMLGFLVVAVLPMLFGAAALDYAALTLPGADPAYARYYGILAVEVFVGLAVTGALLLIFDVLTERSRR